MSAVGRVLRTRRARRDLIDIWDFIAADNTSAADEFLDRIDAVCARLLDYPELGSGRDDIRSGLRHFVVGEYLILYRVIKEGIEVVRVVHGRRDIFNLF